MRFSLINCIEYYTIQLHGWSYMELRKFLAGTMWMITTISRGQSERQRRGNRVFWVRWGILHSRQNACKCNKLHLAIFLMNSYAHWRAFHTVPYVSFFVFLPFFGCLCTYRKETVRWNNNNNNNSVNCVQLKIHDKINIIHIGMNYAVEMQRAKPHKNWRHQTKKKFDVHIFQRKEAPKAVKNQHRKKKRKEYESHTHRDWNRQQTKTRWSV